MKLVEILARELKEWPEYVKCIAQDSDGCAHPWGGCNLEYKNGELNSGTEIVRMAAYTVKMILADDHKSAIVTRAQWEAERARIAAMEGVSAFSQEQANAEAGRDQQAQYEQELWDRVAAACYAQNVQVNREREGAAICAFDDADAFMAERAKHMAKKQHTACVG